MNSYSWGIAPVISRAFLLDVSIVEATSVLVVGEETAYYLKKLVPVRIKEPGNSDSNPSIQN
jgi:hypothetical protein